MLHIGWDNLEAGLSGYMKRKDPPLRAGLSFHGIRQRPTLPGRLQPSTIGAERLNFCVRYGNRWIPFAIVTGNLIGFCVPWKPHIQTSLHLVRPVSNFPFGLNSILLDQVLDRLVSSSSKCCHSFTDDLSPGSLPGVLLLSNGTLILEVGFTLRCLQRLSHPHFASLLCRWHDNSCTSDASTPVLSY